MTGGWWMIAPILFLTYGWQTPIYGFVVWREISPARLVVVSRVLAYHRTTQLLLFSLLGGAWKSLPCLGCCCCCCRNLTKTGNAVCHYRSTKAPGKTPGTRIHAKIKDLPRLQFAPTAAVSAIIIPPQGVSPRSILLLSHQYKMETQNKFCQFSSGSRSTGNL